jgi:predicted ATP-binding protein involved in virulence
VRDLSLGYQTALAWIVDFASRMMDRYPDSDTPFAEPAICLVDEIDLHTHPRWQKQLVQTLRKIFNQTQFIVTAHSPLIVQATEDANIVLLKREGDHVVIENNVDHIRNWRVDQILSSELFSNVGGESAFSERLEAERTLLVEKGAERNEKEETRLQEIDEELDSLPSGTKAKDRDAAAFIREAATWLKETKKA